MQSAQSIAELYVEQTGREPAGLVWENLTNHQIGLAAAAIEAGLEELNRAARRSELAPAYVRVGGGSPAQAAGTATRARSRAIAASLYERS